MGASKMKTSTRIVVGLIVLLLLISAIALFIFIRMHMKTDHEGPHAFVSANASYASLRDDPVPYIVEDNETIFVVSTTRASTTKLASSSLLTSAETGPTSTETTESTSISSSESKEVSEEVTEATDETMSSTARTTQEETESTEAEKPSTIAQEESTSTVATSPKSSEDMGNPPICLIEEMTFNRADCQASSLNDDFNADWLNPSFMLPEVTSLVRPISYDLNLTLANKHAPILYGAVRIFLEIVNDTSNILLHADRQISNLDIEQIAIRNCADGKPVCIRSVTRLIDQKVALLSLNEKLPKGTSLVIQIANFETDVRANPVMFQQVPSKWEKDRAWVLGSFFEKHGSKSVFPCVDGHFTRATFHLCIQHPNSLTSRSNMPEESRTASNDVVTTCFTKTPATSTHQYGLILFENMQRLSSGQGQTPEVEVFFGKHLEPSESQWIIQEVQSGFRQMESLTGAAFPIPRLTVISSELPVDGLSSLGLILVKETWIEYPKYLLTHTILIRQLVHQWISNALMLCKSPENTCLQARFDPYSNPFMSTHRNILEQLLLYQHSGRRETLLFEGLTTYLEWAINADLALFNVSTHKRFVEAKQRLLSTSGDRPPLAYQPEVARDECAERTALVFYMLENNFGSISRALQNLMQRSAWGSCVSSETIARVMGEVSNSPIGERLFSTYMSSSEYPIIKAELFHNRTLVLSQENSQSDKNDFFTTPIVLTDDRGNTQRFVLDSGRYSIPFAGSVVALDVEQHVYARVVYNVENYEGLKSCYQSPSSCAIPRDALKNAFNDLCFAFLNNRLDNSGRNVQSWYSLFDSIGTLSTELGLRDCECCMKRQKDSAPRCKWIWKDKCSKLSLAPHRR